MRGKITLKNGWWEVTDPAIRNGHPIIILIDNIGLVPLPNGWTEEELVKYVNARSRKN